MANPAPTLNQINAFNATQGTTIDFNIIGGTEVIRSNKIYIYDLSDNSLICTHLYVSTESIHELPPNTSSSIVYASGKSSADFTNNTQYYAQIQTFTDTAGTQGGSGLSVAKMFWCLVDPTLTITTIPSTISTTSYNVSATYNANTSVVSNIIQQYQFNLYSATGSLLQSSGVVVGSGTQQGTSTAYDISYNFTGLNVGSSYYVTVNVTTTQGMSVSAQSNTFTVSIDTPTVGGAIVNNNACDGYISVVSNLSDEYGGHVSGEMASFETDSVNNVSSLKVNMEPIQEGSGTPSPTNIRPIRGHSGVNAYVSPTQSADDGTKYSQEFDVSLTPTSTDKVPYTFKAVGQDVYGDRESDKIVGGTVAWNQLIEHGNFDEATGWSSAGYGAITVANNIGTLTISDSSGSARIERVFTPIVGHKYLAYMDFKPSFDASPFMSFQASSYNSQIGRASVSAGNWVRCIGIRNVVADDTTSGRIRYYFGTTSVVGDTVQFRNAGLIDLTAMFGSTIADYIYSLEQATAGAGVAWFKKLFPKDYYPYDPGTLRSVEGVSRHETVGLNQWDEEWEVGLLNSDGTISATGNRTVSKNFIRVVAGTTYYLSWNGDGSVGRGAFYDADFNCISYYVDFPLNTKLIEGSRYGSIITIPSGASYMKFCMSTAYGTTYNHDICINISDPTRNGEYEPYQKHTYPLDSSLTLRGVPKLDASNNLYYDGDTYESDGGVTRKYGIVTFDGSSDENISAGTSGYPFRILLPQDSTTQSVITEYTNTFANYLTHVRQSDTWGVAMTFSRANGQRYLYFKITDSMTDISELRTYLANHPLIVVYELATPTTETAEPFTNPQVVDNGGTEAYVTTSIVPVGHDTTYLTRDIFGGTLDLVTGVLTVDRAMVDLKTLTWTLQTWGGYMSLNLVRTAKRPPNNYTAANAICTHYRLLPTNILTTNTLYSFGIQSDGRLFVRLENGKTDSDITGLLCYELATPQTYQLTPHQIQTLVGQNNVWSDAGDVDVTFNLPISNLLVKRQDASDVSGNWLTLYSQPITQASDMDFTFIDFLNQYGKTYKYALVPLLTQTQSGVEVEVEGGYTVSDEVQSIFDGVFIADSTGSQKCKANVGYGNVDMNQTVGTITPIGAQYPVVITNSKNQYHNGSISGTIVPDDYYFNGNLSRIDMVNKRNELEQFLTNKRAKIIKDWNSNIWLVMILDNVSCSFNNNYGMGMVNFSTNWIEVGDPTNQQDLQATGLINVGGA